MKKHFVRLDRYIAGWVWSGQYTISAECGASRCWFCRLVRMLLGWRHCVEAAFDEGRLREIK